MKKISFGRIFAHDVTFAEALDEITALAAKGAGGTVLTPNVDHVVIAEHDDALASAYDACSLSLVDGQPLVWLSHALGQPLPEKISGSDLVVPLLARAARERLRVYLLGARAGVGLKAKERLQYDLPTLNIVGVDAPELGFERDPTANEAVLARIREAKPHLLLVALGAPKQELWMQKNRAAFAPAVAIGVGGTLDFIAGEVKRAPRIVSQLGAEWLYRLAQEPRRLAHRYLVRDREIVGIAWRTWRRTRREATAT
jgi:N-acetylglucosaminyldiphosphoundecaprenol N-acetyl-beta-D-mannosaminyltransferase